MRRLVGAAVLSLLVFASVATAELKITGTLAVESNKMVRLAGEGAVAGSALIWDVSNDKACDTEEVQVYDKEGKPAGTKLFLTGPAGSYKVKLRAIRFDKDGRTHVETATAVVSIGTPPPGPTPTPEPDPGPPPVPAPIPLPGLRILIVEESKERAKLPRAQRLIILGKPMRDYMDAKCVREVETNQAGWWILDKDVDTSAMPKHWRDAMKRPRTSIPWLIVSNGRTGYEGPLPASVPDMLDLLKKYAN
jgi:hypothetical protein